MTENGFQKHVLENGGHRDKELPGLFEGRPSCDPCPGPRCPLPSPGPNLSWPLSPRDLQVHGLVLPLMLPSFYSELFTLYLLLHEREDGLYSQGIASLSLFPDTKLLEFLDVQK